MNTATASANAEKMSIIRPNQITIDKYIRINKDQYMFFLQLLQECDIYDYEIYNEEQIIRKGRNIFQIKNNGKQYHYLLISRNQNYFLKFYFYRIVGKSNEIQLIDEKFLFIDVNKWLKENKNSQSHSSSLSTFVPKNNVHMEIKPYQKNQNQNQNQNPTPTSALPSALSEPSIPIVPKTSNITNPYVREYIQQQNHFQEKYKLNNTRMGDADDDEMDGNYEYEDEAEDRDQDPEAEADAEEEEEITRGT
jgi:hypothetical protein